MVRAAAKQRLDNGNSPVASGLRKRGVNPTADEAEEPWVWNRAQDLIVHACGDSALVKEAARTKGFRHHAARHPEQRQQCVISVQCVEMHQLRAAGVGHVDGVHASVNATGQVPQQKGFHVAEQERSTCSGRGGAEIAGRASFGDDREDALPDLRRAMLDPARVAAKSARAPVAPRSRCGLPGYYHEPGAGDSLIQRAY